MKKYGTPEEATPIDDGVVEEHLSKTGKTLEELTEEEKEELWEEIDELD